MRVLGLDTATLTASAAIIESGRLVGEFTLNTEKVHSRRLMPLVASLLAECGLFGDGLDGIAVSAGPGSFTGLRIGMATAKGLAFAWQKPVVRVPTLEALAFNLSGQAGLVCPLLDARREEVYGAVYRVQAGELVTVREGAAVPLESILADLAAWIEPVTFLGDAIPRFRPLIAERLGERAKWAPPALALPRGSSVAELGRRMLLAGQADDAYSLQPLYLRRSQAEVLWEANRSQNDGA